MIGIIDSGFGGLSVVAEMQRQNITTPFVYLGDNAHVPYGEKTTAEIKTLAFNMIHYLLENYTLDCLVIACNTIVAACMDEITAAFPTLYIENIVAHGAVGALQSFTEHVAVLATQKTVTSGIYSRYIDAFADEVQVTEIAASAWVTMVEKQEIQRADIIEKIREIPKEVDVIILGCTHFPFLYKEIRALIPEHVQIIDPAYSCVQQLTVPEDSIHTSIFLTTGFSEKFSRFLDNQNIQHTDIPVQKIIL